MRYLNEIMSLTPRSAPQYFPIFYIIFTFFVFPLSLLGISILWAEGLGNGR